MDHELTVALPSTPVYLNAAPTRLAQVVGFFRMGGKGSHVVYTRAGEPMILTFQNRGGYIPPYQARQLIEMMDKYEG